jgi:hypothetical protein
VAVDVDRFGVKGKVTATGGNFGVKITFNGKGAGTMKVKQWMQLEVYPKYQCPGFCDEGVLPPDRDLDVPAKPGHKPHDHKHISGTRLNPRFQIDIGGSKTGFYEGPYQYHKLKNPDVKTYTDDPSYGMGAAIKAQAYIPKKKTVRGKDCTLSDIKVVQRLVTQVFVNGRAIATVHWTTTVDGPPGKPGHPVTKVENVWEGAIKPDDISKGLVKPDGTLIEDD